jgi:glyoxylase-like metal-dependent hydrolase (beta-lactamase superfamily II)
MNITPFLSDQGVISYIISDSSNQAVLIDPSCDSSQQMVAFLFQRKLNPIYLLETHTHADFFSGKDLFKDIFPNILVGLSHLSPTSKKNLHLHQGDRLDLADGSIAILETPGHTNESITYVLESHSSKSRITLFTGDTLLIGGTGRTDFQAGDSRSLYQSLKKILDFPDTAVIHPNHNYQKQVASSLGVERVTNARLSLVVHQKEEEFVTLMGAHNPPIPDLFDLAIPFNSL